MLRGLCSSSQVGLPTSAGTGVAAQTPARPAKKFSRKKPVLQKKSPRWMSINQFPRNDHSHTCRRAWRSLM